MASLENSVVNQVDENAVPPAIVTIVIPVLNERWNLEGCISSLLAGTYPVDQLEIFVVDGGSTDGTIGLIEALASEHAQIHLLHNERTIQAAAMNNAIENASGEFLVRLDAHSKYQTNHVEKIVERLKADDAENVGGVQYPVGSGFFGRVAAASLRSSLSMGSSTHRMADSPSYAETVFLGGWKTSTLRRLGGFNDNWKINEDYELNVRLLASGGRVLVLPELQCEYSVRSNIASLSKQYFRYGFWRVRTMRCHRSAAKLRHLAPVVLLISLAVSIVLMIVGFSIGIVIPAAYVALLAGFGIKQAMAERSPALVVTPVAFASIHISFGTGMIAGAVRWMIKPCPNDGGLPDRWLSGDHDG